MAAYDEGRSATRGSGGRGPRCRDRRNAPWHARHRWWLPSLMVLCLGVAPIARAATPLTLPHAVRTALAHQPSLQADARLTKAGEFRMRAHRGVLFPQLGVQAGDLYSSNHNGTTDFVAANGPRELTSLLVLHQILYDPAATAAVDAARARAAFARYRALRNRLTVALAVAQTYYDLQAAQAAARVWDAAARTNRKVVAVTRQALSAGNRARIDLLRAEAALSQAEGAQSQARARAAGARQLLSLMTGLAPLPPVPAATPVAETFTLPPPGEVETAALRDQPVLHMARSQERQQSALVRQARGARLPQIGVQAAYGWDTLGSLRQRTLGWSAGLELTAPLFAGGTLRDREDAARLERQAAHLRYQQTRLEVREAVSTAWNDAQGALAAYRSAVAVSRTKQEIWRDSEAGYRAGRMGSLALFLAQQDWLDSRIQALGAAAQLRFALVRLNLVAGRLPAREEP
ncbi:MAG: hypothetical protein B7Z66_07685 [Chromatiales bacterium 21-64-14]|nr:MAG: hypothetical protein B7Z66_07685 [Chromatiales bacterium 21-64-14]